jgi:hypothetical protein
MMVVLLLFASPLHLLGKQTGLRDGSLDERPKNQRRFAMPFHYFQFHFQPLSSIVLGDTSAREAPRRQAYIIRLLVLRVP